MQSGVFRKIIPRLIYTKNKVGIFSRAAKLTDIVENGDRIEIYRPLIADPKEIRRKKAEEQAKIKEK